MVSGAFCFPKPGFLMPGMGVTEIRALSEARGKEPESRCGYEGRSAVNAKGASLVEPKPSDERTDMVSEIRRDI